MFISPKLQIIDRVNKKSDFFCAFCGFPLVTMDDFKINEKNECCYECYQTYAESRIKEWNEGWRPDKTRLEEYIYLRKKMYFKIITFEEK